MAQDKLYFKNLDSIRFIAAMMVFLGHGISPAYQYLPIANTFWQRLLNTISHGATGVSIFFVLSGFLITFLLVSEHETAGGISIRNFYIRRVLRIWPLYFLVVGFSFGIYPLLKGFMGVNNPLGSNVLYHLVFLSNFDVLNIAEFCKGNDAMSQNITWSVSVEEQFYLVWPLLFAFLPQRLWLSALVFIIAGSLVFRLVNYDERDVLSFHTLSVVLDLGIGGLLALLIKTRTRIRALFERTDTTAHLILFLFSLLLLLYVDVLFDFPYGRAVARVFTAFSFALVISAQAMSRTNSAFGLGNLRFANRWGRYTYGIYLLHPIAITLLDVLARLLHIPMNNFWASLSFGVLGFVATLFLSSFSYRWYEAKFLALKGRFSTIQTRP